MRTRQMPHLSRWVSEGYVRRRLGLCAQGKSDAEIEMNAVAGDFNGDLDQLEPGACISWKFQNDSRTPCVPHTQLLDMATRMHGASAVSVLHPVLSRE